MTEINDWDMVLEARIRTMSYAKDIQQAIADYRGEIMLELRDRIRAESEQDDGKAEVGDVVAILWHGPTISKWVVLEWSDFIQKDANYFKKVAVLERAAEVKRRLELKKC